MIDVKNLSKSFGNHLVLVMIFTWLQGKLERRLRQSDRR